MRSDWRVRQADWACDEDRARIERVRRTVFIQEQQVPPELEYDGLDADAVQLLALVGEEPVGTARMLADGHIGRVAVLNPWRGKGIGAALVSMFIRIADERGLTTVDLDAQTHALGFYERLGFHAHGPEFLDAGIPHRHMHRSLREPDAPSDSM